LILYFAHRLRLHGLKYKISSNNRQLFIQAKFLFFCVAAAKSDLCSLIVDVSISQTIKHTHTHTHKQTNIHRNVHPVRLLSLSDQNVAEAATYTTHNKNKRRTTMTSAGFETPI